MCANEHLWNVRECEGMRETDPARKIHGDSKT